MISTSPLGTLGWIASLWAETLSLFRYVKFTLEYFSFSWYHGFLHQQNRKPRLNWDIVESGLKLSYGEVNVNIFGIGGYFEDGIFIFNSCKVVNYMSGILFFDFLHFVLSNNHYTLRFLDWTVYSDGWMGPSVRSFVILSINCIHIQILVRHYESHTAREEWFSWTLKRCAARQHFPKNWHELWIGFSSKLCKFMW